jgi:lipooligosaccharide transport system ATP-binding protein
MNANASPNSSPQLSLSVDRLEKSYGHGQSEVRAVAGVSFGVPRGTCFGLLGPNGAGKTTTLRCCLGLTEPDAGRVGLLGHVLPQQAREARQRVGIVPQFDSLDPDFTVGENLLVYARYFGLSDAAVEPKIPELLDFAGLAGKAREPLRSLSGGMKRRLSLARALVNDPDMLFLDEPTTGLDPQARHLIWERLKRLTAQGKTLLLTTHFMDEAERLCHRLAIIDHGRKIAEGAPRELIATHIEPQVVEVYGESGDAVAGFADSPQARAGGDVGRIEVSGETAFIYCHDSAPVVAALADRPDLRYVHRAANLEDVFLKLTGRELRD